MNFCSYRKKQYSPLFFGDINFRMFPRGRTLWCAIDTIRGYGAVVTFEIARFGMCKMYKMSLLVRKQQLDSYCFAGPEREVKLVSHRNI